MEEVILVTEKDKRVGQGEKQWVHEEGLLHRAFSIYVFNEKDELLLQRRADTKYHNPGMWSNTCCGHPRPHEGVRSGVLRRLDEEMGLRLDSCKKQGEFVYEKEFSNGLSENEYLHVFTSKTSKEPVLNPREASEYKWLSLENVKKDVEEHPGKYTYWFKLTLKKLF
mgnify:CR=1 FL=1